MKIPAGYETYINISSIIFHCSILQIEMDHNYENYTWHPTQIITCDAGTLEAFEGENVRIHTSVSVTTEITNLPTLSHHTNGARHIWLTEIQIIDSLSVYDTQMNRMRTQYTVQFKEGYQLDSTIKKV